MLKKFHLCFRNFPVFNNRWLHVALIALVSSCINFTQDLCAQVYNSIPDGSYDGDVFFRSRSCHALHSFTNFMNSVAMNVAY